MKKLLNAGGHGGKDTGCIAFDGSFEKKYSLILSTKIYNIVEQYLKNDSFILRQDDKYISLKDRCRIADELAPVYWFEWHFNAFNKKARGIEIFTSKFTSEKNKDFAKYLCNEYSKLFNIPNRGAQWRLNSKGLDYYYLHRNTGSNTTVFIVEPLFIDNEDDFKILKSDKFMDKTAHFFAKNILNLLYNIEIKPGPKKEIYRVYSGAFSKESNAKKRVSDLKKHGFDAYYKLENK